ncbi:probable aquaporin TIP1-2 [Selaginella moellendorffii]|uniref:probable aquaporin TIP1-2 n=1 Tax=Selaginella moellendorffii TaxID=88036 RepID=UPI000D1C2546|nr:probable aquaporin TIP1-2 [Selaginella moellendorffii]|eukprot:XP_002971144.2 probable aquaporin TIP1-2 [Selaginella moellendorffii]
MVLGYVSPSKLVMYTGAQCVGSIFASLCAKLVLPDDLALKFALGGCVMQNSAGSGLSIGSAFVAESMFTFVLMFVVANLALDPFQGRAFGAILPPSFIGAAAGLLIFASGGLVVGYSGAGMNPARCLGPAVVMGSSSTRDGHWVWWIAPYSATVMVSVLYCLVPPHHAELYRGREDLGSVKEAFHPPIVHGIVWVRNYLDPKGVRAHSHPRASKLVYVEKGLWRSALWTQVQLQGLA